MPTIIDGTNGIDNIAAGAIQKSDLPTGSVLQLVSSSTTTNVSSSTSTYADTGLSATITPTSASSKILVLVGHTTIQVQSNSTGCGMKLLRNSTEINRIAFYVGYANIVPQYDGGISVCYLDSPASTSALTYKTQFNSESNSASVTLQPSSSMSTITLMEIAA